MTKGMLLLAAALGVSLSLTDRAAAEELVLAEDGQSAYRIGVAADASPSTRHGAEELQMFLEQMTGAKLPIVSDSEPVGEREIILGDGQHLGSLALKIDFDQLGHEGYVIRTAGNHLVIAGGSLRGNMSGVDGLLGGRTGCRAVAAGAN